MAQAKRRLAAILAADVAGYSRLMGDNERATLNTLNAYRDVFRKNIADRDGRVVDTAGDSVLAVFGSVVEAVQCAAQVQSQLEDRNADLPENRRMQFRIGVNLGDVFEQDDGTIYGDGVNVAARLEALAEPGGITVSESAHMQVEGKTDFGFRSIGDHEVKNIARPVRAYCVLTDETVHTQNRIRGNTSGRFVGLAAAVVVVALVISVVVWQWLPGPEAEFDGVTVPPEKPSIAVLPFKNLGRSADQDYFAEGIAEDIITDLSKVSGLFVISPNSSFGFAADLVDDGEGIRSLVNAAAAATELNVRYVLQGSVRRFDESVRINVQLLDPSSGQHLWAERYDRSLADIFAVQNEIAERVVTELSVRIGDTERQQMFRAHTDNMEAYDLFLRGRRLQGGFDPASNAEARSLIEMAIKLDPEFAAAHAELSWIYMQSYWFAWTEDLEGSVRRATEAAKRAVQLDDTLAAAHANLGWSYFGMRRFDDAITEARRALALEPNYGDGYLILSEILTQAGFAEEGIEVVRQGIPLDPYLTYHYLLHIASGYIVLGRYDEAIEAAKRSLDHKSDWPGAYIILAALYGQLGPLEQAGKMYAEALRYAPDYTIEKGKGVFAYRDQSITDWILEGLRNARKVARS